MRKKYFLFLFISLFTFNGFGQIVISSCSAPDSILEQYTDDADRLALRTTFADSTTYIDSVVINQSLSDSLLNALIAVYNATPLPARDTVILIYNIHTWPDRTLDVLEVSADSNLSWMQQLDAGNINTGNAQVDSLISNYYLHIAGYSHHFGLFPYHSVVFESDSNWNIQVLASLFFPIFGVYYSEPGGWVGDGNNITHTITSNFIELIYSYGWGDCPAGCTCRRYWKFRVYYDCSVEYAGSYGCPLPVSVPEHEVKNSFVITPNPAGDFIKIKFNLPRKKNISISLYNLYGEKLKTLFEGECMTGRNEMKFSLKEFPAGIYFISMSPDGKEAMKKVIRY